MYFYLFLLSFLIFICIICYYLFSFSLPLSFSINSCKTTPCIQYLFSHCLRLFNLQFSWLVSDPDSFIVLLSRRISFCFSVLELKVYLSFHYTHAACVFRHGLQLAERNNISRTAFSIKIFFFYWMFKFCDLPNKNRSSFADNRVDVTWLGEVQNYINGSCFKSWPSPSGWSEFWPPNLQNFRFRFRLSFVRDTVWQNKN